MSHCRCIYCCNYKSCLNYTTKYYDAGPELKFMRSHEFKLFINSLGLKVTNLLIVIFLLVLK